MKVPIQLEGKSAPQVWCVHAHVLRIEGEGEACTFRGAHREMGPNNEISHLIMAWKAKSPCS